MAAVFAHLGQRVGDVALGDAPQVNLHPRGEAHLVAIHHQLAVIHQGKGGQHNTGKDQQ